MESVDRNKTLCLACSSSLPPRTTSKPADLFTTNCCNRPICPSCVSSNPRLTRYDPCLACLAGVRVVQVSSHRGGRPEMNIDGSVQEGDLFVLGDDEDDAVELGDCNESEVQATSPPAYTSHSTLSNPVDENSESPELDVEPAPPRKYFIKRGDTLIGIAFRFKIDGFELCRLNSLPTSTLNTTPHLLHTRTFLTLPPASSPALPPQQLPLVGPSSSSSRVVQRAQKRLQMVTKEVDWRIARAYVALAEDEEDDDRGKKEDDSKTRTVSYGTLDALAIDLYLDDAEWEEKERREGRGVSIQRFPLRAA